MCLCFCEDTPPEDGSKSKGRKGAQDQLFLDRQAKPNAFALAMKDAPCTEPCCCLASACCSPCGCTACYFRNSVLKNYFNGVQDFVCFQGYIPKICCCDVASCCPGSEIGLCLEGCCCPMLSLSIARIHMMDVKDVRPDPCDWQIIRCSNCLQCLSCLCDIAALIEPSLSDIAAIIDLIADLVALSVAGCMGAQIYHEIKKDPNAKTNGGNGGGAPPDTLEMER
ncbi:hypothetical protein AB1Y20_012035 [Prymnesium parvum]